MQPNTNHSEATMPKSYRLPVTVDKSHIVTIGEKLYTQSVELIRELVNNAYDADATRVFVEIHDERIEVRDDGQGMDLDGLQQYFNIGSPEKVAHNKSPKFHRDRIGQFGIGKFATLSACNRFEIITQRGDFAARVTFDKRDWAKETMQWDLPLEVIPSDAKRGDGTTVILQQLYRNFDLETVRRKIVESVPLRAKNFAVFLNGQRIMLTRLPGQRIAFMEGTDFGSVYGEIVILPSSQANPAEMGIEIRVKGVMVQKSLFGLQSLGREAARIRGEINADFLPVTSDRSGFRIDTPEYKAFEKLMDKIATEVSQQLSKLSDKKETTRVRRAVNDAIERIQQALSANPEFGQSGSIPVGEPTSGVGEPGELRRAEEEDEESERESGREGEGEIEVKAEAEVEESLVVKDAVEQLKPSKPRVSKLTPNAVVKKFRTGDMVVSCCIDHFGADGPESFIEGMIIYINRDHPLYLREAKKGASHTMHVARLLSQEISLMNSPENPRQAFEQQSKILKAAFRE
jgi:hypothetical protein